jgi:YHS domain-containing protein
MVRFLLLSILLTLLLRALSRLWTGFVRGIKADASFSAQSGDGRGRVPQRGVQMVRDPVCGTFVVPERAIALSSGSNQVFFCSADCRDKFRARPDAAHPKAHGRTA